MKALDEQIHSYQKNINQSQKKISAATWAWFQPALN